MTTTGQVLCPVLAVQHNDIITSENVNSLLLSTYERTAGTVVAISCYVPSFYKLEGNSQATCTNGVWVPTPGECVPISKNDVTSSPDDTSTTNDGDSDTYTIALIATASVCAFLLLAVVAALVFKFSCTPSKKSNRSFDSLDDTESSMSRRNYAYTDSSPVSSIPSGGSYGRTFHSAFPGHNEEKSWTYLSVDMLLRDIETSRRENPRHSWRDFVSISTEYATMRL